MFQSGADWSGLSGDLERDRTVWMRVLDPAPKGNDALRVWQDTTQLSERLGDTFPKAGAPQRDKAGRVYQTADIPQNKWSSLHFLMQRKTLGWDGASVLIEQLADELAQAEAAGLQPQGDLRDQILIDGSGEILICGHWEQAVKPGWAGPSLLEMLEQLAGQEVEGRPAIAQLRSRMVVGRLRSALTVASTLRNDEVSPSRARRQIKNWLRDPKPRRKRWPWLLIPLVLGAILITSRLLPLPPQYVPDLVGASQAEATRELSDNGWGFKIKKVPSGYAEGQVIAQRPAPGRKLSPSQKITLTVASPKSLTDVPPLKGLDTGTARDLLAANGLNMKEFFVRGGPSGQVQATRPEEGARLRTGSTVTVTVSP